MLLYTLMCIECCFLRPTHSSRFESPIIWTLTFFTYNVCIDSWMYRMQLHAQVVLRNHYFLLYPSLHTMLFFRRFMCRMLFLVNYILKSLQETNHIALELLTYYATLDALVCGMLFLRTYPLKSLQETNYLDLGLLYIECLLDFCVYKMLFLAP